MTHINRRDLLRTGAAGALFAALGRANSALMPMGSNGFLGSPVSQTAPKLLTIFLRGAQDAVFTVPPVGDPTYPVARGGLMPSTIALPGTTYARLNDQYQDLVPIINAGQAAFIHQVGNPSGGRSHFVEMAIYESAHVPTALTAPRKDGVMARLRGAGVFAGSSGPVYGASVSHRMQQFYRGFTADELMLHVADLRRFSLGTAPIADRQRAALALHLSQDPSDPLESYLDATGEYFAATEAAVSGLGTYTHDPNAFPRTLQESNAAGLPDSSRGRSFLKQCEEAHQLLKSNLGCQVVGVELGSWDTHANQAAEVVDLNAYLAKAIRSLYDAGVADGLDNYLILVVTEFGRTNFVNSNAGTDHGVGGLMMAFGKKVMGGVYNCHGGVGLGKPWRELGTSPSAWSTFGNACPVVTDFREIYSEIFEKLFGMSTAQVSTVIPGWSDTSRLGFLS